MPRYYLYAALLLLTQCSKCKDDPRPKTEEDKLPTATQTGANTFGCLVNGQAFTPQGNISLTQKLSVDYDPNVGGGSFSLYAHKVNSRQSQTITFSLLPVAAAGTYSLDRPRRVGVVYYSNSTNPLACRNIGDEQDLTYRQGSFTLTRLDRVQRIAAGTFSVTMACPGCDTIRITEGRFDVKY